MLFIILLGSFSCYLCEHLVVGLYPIRNPFFFQFSVYFGYSFKSIFVSLTVKIQSVSIVGMDSLGAIVVNEPA